MGVAIRRAGIAGGQLLRVGGGPGLATQPAIMAEWHTAGYGVHVRLSHTLQVPLLGGG